MPRRPQFNVALSAKDDPDDLPKVHQIVDQYKAAHRGMSKFAALYELLKIAERVTQSKQGATPAND